MDTIAFWDTEFSEKLEGVKSSIAGLSRLHGPTKVQAAKRCETMILEINSKTRRNFVKEMRQLDSESKGPYKQKLENYDRDLEKLSGELKWIDKSSSSGEEISRDDMLRQAEVVQDKTEASLARSLAQAEEMNQIGEETLVKMNEQTEQMLKTNEKLDNMDNELDKAQDIMKSMIRRMLTDKLVLLFVGLIFLALLGVVIYVAVKPPKEQQANPTPSG